MIMIMIIPTAMYIVIRLFLAGFISVGVVGVDMMLITQKTRASDFQ
jgi:hypothetical protein